MEEYQIIVAFKDFVAEYGKPMKDKKQAQVRANKLLDSLKPKTEFNVSVTIEKRLTRQFKKPL